MASIDLHVGQRSGSGASGAIFTLVPGVALAAGVAGVAMLLRGLPGLGWFSPMILAVTLGAGLGTAMGGAPGWARPGLRFALRPVLRFAIVLLGLQLTAAQVAAIGGSGVVALALTLLATFLFTTWMGRVLGVERRLAQLIAAGTSICGASAVVATNTVTEAPDEDVAYAVACVTLFGTLAMVSFPLVAGLLEMGPRLYGLWVGASVHEVGQVVAAAFQRGQEAGEFGTVAKLTRVMFLAPVVIGLGLMARRGRAAEGAGAKAPAPAPWFVLGFALMVGLNSVAPVPAEAKAWIVPLTGFLLAAALAAVGLETNLKKLAAKGWRPLALGFAAFLFVSVCGLLLVSLAG